MINNVIDSIISPATTRQPNIPEVEHASVLLGYSGGNGWPTFHPFQQARQDLDRINRVIPVTLACNAFGHMYDIEPGGGENRNIGIFMHNAKNVWKTQNRWGLQWLYTFASNVQAMVAAARSFGYEQGRDYYVLSAHANSRFGAHICSPTRCGFPQADGTQYRFAPTYDESVISDYMVHGGTPLPPPPPPSPWPLVKLGDRGLQVSAVQYLLGHLVVDGIFGTATHSTVMAFQQAHRLTPDGIVGPSTWPMLTPTIQQGARGQAVYTAQELLSRHGIAIKVDSLFGSATHNAVVQFQRNASLVADGIVGPKTWQKLV